MRQGYQLVRVSVDNKIRFGFGFAIAILIVVGAISYFSISALTATLNQVVKGHNTEATLEELVSHLRDAQRGERGYVLTGNEQFLEPYHQALQELESEIDDLERLLVDNRDQMARLEALKPLTAEALAKMARVIELRREAGFEAAAQVVGDSYGKRVMDRIVEIAEVIEEEEERHLSDRSAEASLRAGWVLLFIAFSGVLAVAIVVVASIVINRDITERRRAEAALQAAYGGLERRVEDRTRQLADANDDLKKEVTERARTEKALSQMLEELAQSRSNLASILNQLQVGSALTDGNGRITFLSNFAQRVFGTDSEQALGKPWESALPLRPTDIARLQEMSIMPVAERSRVPVCIDGAGGRRYWMEIDIQDDPRNSAGRILFLYDVSEAYDLRRLLDKQSQFEDIIGRCDSMARVFQQIQDVGKVDSTVLIEGETGTGKELVARALHASSHRKEHAFVAVNCAGLSESLIDSQLFGHKKGAFTGAVSDREGLFEAANGGTLFLDEIGDIPLSIQTSLLRVLQEREITRVGESRARTIDVRILAATHRNLTEEVENGTFRADLLYRVRVARIQLPPLRERREDLPLLVAAFLNQGRAATGKPVQEVSEDAMRAMLAYTWPGNVRELKSAVEFAVIRSRDTLIRTGDLPPEVLLEARDPEADGVAPLRSPDTEREKLLRALERTNGNRSAAARMLGVGRTTLYRRLKALGIP